ncbi:MAG: hypothetical protein A2X78_00800 [Gammaproteobacteria bacterium GWE2_37_16]|nr:MAG: hypothetical protein A2X78_00800 [Gammaproteobacteria bacterium GWE2_37_16]
MRERKLYIFAFLLVLYPPKTALPLFLPQITKLLPCFLRVQWWFLSPKIKVINSHNNTLCFKYLSYVSFPSVSSRRQLFSIKAVLLAYSNLFTIFKRRKPCLF